MTTANGSQRTAALAALTARAADRARTTNRAIVVSLVEAIEPLDPLASMQSTAEPAFPPQARATLGDGGHMYWARPADQFSVAALGVAATLTATGTERFSAIDRAWNELMEGALIDDPSNGATGAGPMLLGGFAFEPDGPRTEDWRHFPSGCLVLPRLLIAASGGRHWLTTILVVAADGRPDIEPAGLSPLREWFGGEAQRYAYAKSVTVDRPPVAEELLPASEWRGIVDSALGVIRAGTLEKVVLARAVRAKSGSPFDIFAALRHLRETNRTSFVFGCWRGNSAFIGASPELLVRLDGRDAVASSLAGSAPRGATPDEDIRFGASLLASAKNRREHAIVRRALCDRLAQICDDVSAAPEPSLITLAHVHHLHTAVRAHLRDGYSLLDLVGRLHPTPAVGGAPRDESLAFIRAHEQLDRGWYAGPIGWLQREHGEFAVALRSALIVGREATLYAGCGIVADSDAEREYAESILKLRPMTAALAAAQRVDESVSAAAAEGEAP